jgi:hypothetical protein
MQRQPHASHLRPRASGPASVKRLKRSEKTQRSRERTKGRVARTHHVHEWRKNTAANLGDPIGSACQCVEPSQPRQNHRQPFENPPLAPLLLWGVRSAG